MVHQCEDIEVKVLARKNSKDNCEHHFITVIPEHENPNHEDEIIYTGVSPAQFIEGQIHMHEHQSILDDEFDECDEIEVQVTFHADELAPDVNSNNLCFAGHGHLEITEKDNDHCHHAPICLHEVLIETHSGNRDVTLIFHGHLDSDVDLKKAMIEFCGSFMFGSRPN